MNCLHCQIGQTRRLDETTDLGYAVAGASVGSTSETGSPFNHLEFPPTSYFEVVRCRLRYRLSLRDLAEMLFLRFEGVLPVPGHRSRCPIWSTRCSVRCATWRLLSFLPWCVSVIGEIPRQVTSDGHDS
jgi:hypothetical protein